MDEQQKEISELQKHQAVLDVKLDSITQSIVEIKVNHLVHINDKLAKLNTGIIDLNTCFNDKITGIYSKISDLKINDAKQEPTGKLISEIIKFVLIGIIGAGLALIIDTR